MKLPKSEAEAIYLTNDLGSEIQRVITETVKQYNESNVMWRHLVTTQRMMLFRGLVTYLYKFIVSPMMEKTISMITTHAVVQAIVGLASAKDIDLSIEPNEESVDRSVHPVPRWLVEGLKLYYLEVRPSYIPASGVGKVKRRFADQPTLEIETEYFFVNSVGSTKFRARSVADQITANVSIFSCFSQISEHPSFLNCDTH